MKTANNLQRVLTRGPALRNLPTPWTSSRTMLATTLLCAVCLALALAPQQACAQDLKLTPKELAYVREHPTATICVDPDWEPFERINEQGEHVGIAADLLKLVSQRTGVRFILHPTKTWDESLAASQTGRCQILSFLNTSPKREEWLAFTEPLLKDPNVFITREEHPFIAEPESLAGESIALPRGTFVEEMIRRDYPNIKVIATTTEGEAVDLVSEHKADMTMRSLIVSAYTIRKQGLFNLKISGQIPDYANRLRMGVVREAPLLLGILDKGVRAITPREREEITNRHVAITVQMGVDYGPIVKMAALGLLLLACGLYWTLRLRKLNRELKRLAQTDQLTGLKNRAKLDEQLPAELERAQRYNRPLSLLMFDIDRFKNINDELGHLMGDKVLVGIGRTARQHIRSTDMLGRWGGEEFLVLCPETELPEALVLAERIRNGIEAASFPSGLQHTVSVGVTQAAPSDSVDTLLHRADNALYAAKNQGRNLVRSA